MKLYNTLTRKKEKFEPITPCRVTMYVCGATVYDECHVGHARSAYVFDTIVRYLRFCGYDVLYVRNVTDVDDKIIEKARKELKCQGVNVSECQGLNDKVKEVSNRYLEMYRRDMQRLGIGEPDVEPKATEHIADMIRAIEVLIKKGYAYNAGGNVYFSVRKLMGYGKLSGQSELQMKAGARPAKICGGARIEVEPDKKDPLDFALWKKAKPDEPSWDSPFGPGRPGWHIECSAMSARYLGDNFDIHAGGADLMFPHHENEIAQSKAMGKKFAKYWLHNGLLTINGQKMAKSLGNFVTISQALADFHPEALKIFFLSSHYSSPIDFTFEKLKEAQRARERFYVLFERIDSLCQERGDEGRGKRDEGRGKKKRALDFKMVGEYKDKFMKAMDDDFNMPLALGCLFELVAAANKFMEQEQLAPRGVLLLNYAALTLRRLGGVFGLFSGDTPHKQEEKPREESLEQKLIGSFIELRSALRDKKEFELSDKIRRDLSKVGVILEDTKEKTIWRRE